MTLFMPVTEFLVKKSFTFLLPANDRINYVKNNVNFYIKLVGGDIMGKTKK